MGAADASEKKSVQDYGEGCGDGRGSPVSAKGGSDADNERSNDQNEFDGTQCGQARRRREQEGEVLDPAFAELGEGAIHAGADGIGGVAEEYFSSRAFDSASQSYVFEDFAGDGGVAADGVVGFARDQNVLAVGGRGGRFGVAYLRRAKADGEFGEDHGHNSFFKEGLNYLPGRVGKQSCVASPGFVDSPLERAGQVNGIGVGE